MTNRAAQTALNALDTLGVALADKQHQWTRAERRAYERGVSACKAAGAS